MIVNIAHTCRLLRELVKARQEMNQLLQQTVEEQQLLVENARVTTPHHSEEGKMNLVFL